MSVILTQTDTTVGFLSQNASKLFEIKSRDRSKPFIKIYPTLKHFKQNFKRIPTKYKNLVRRSKKTTFVVKNQAFRIVPQQVHSQLLRDLTWYYSTSANQSHKKFERSFCESKADIVIEDSKGLFENNSSKLIKINKKAIKRLR